MKRCLSRFMCAFASSICFWMTWTTILDDLDDDGHKLYAVYKEPLTEEEVEARDGLFSELDLLKYQTSEHYRKVRLLHKATV
mmetsp:Transcript_46495/g.77265  ORF Transcript_46495/g.77265 Transcript_46495/m.77265 type:complete len:82 (-) Transcript_46495:685-930(-)